MEKSCLIISIATYSAKLVLIYPIKCITPRIATSIKFTFQLYLE